jgi:CHAT domain-containing protein/tetratricopeptide (TPR) repeat protein
MTPHSTRCHAVLTLAGALLVCAPAGASDRFADCDRALSNDARARASAECFFKTAEAAGDLDAGEARLQRARSGNPGSPWLTFYLAETRASRQPATALEFFRASVQEFRAARDPHGEVEARVRLGWASFVSGRADEAWRQVSESLSAASASGDPALVARAKLWEVWLITSTGERLERGQRLLNEVWQAVVPDGPYSLQRQTLFGLGNIEFSLGQYSQAIVHFQRAESLARQHDDGQARVSARYNVLSARRRQMEQLPERDRVPEFTREARELVDMAEAVGAQRHRAFAHRTLGDMLAASPDTAPEARAQYEEALRYARASSDRTEIGLALWALGRILIDVDPGASRRLIGEALALAATSGNRPDAAAAWRQQMRLGWTTLPFDGAVAQSMQALDAIETLRALQDQDLASTAVFSTWMADYYWLIGALLERRDQDPRGVALAFEVAERMRARGLLDALIVRSDRRRSDGASERAARRDAILREIARTQTKLLALGADDPERALAEHALERLERDEEAERDPRRPGAIPRASIEQVQRALAADEALLSYTIGLDQNLYGRSAGGSWLTIVTRDRVRVITLPDRAVLHPVVSVAIGALDRPHAASGRMAVRLYDLLLSEAIASLSSGISRLVVIADGPLHEVPFPRLTRDPAAAPIGSRYQIASVPSATLWLRWKQSRRESTPGALVFADPQPPDAWGREAPAVERSWWPSTMKLGRLPHSRGEGSAIVARIGGRLLVGAEATEAALRSSDFSRFAILHLAAHSVIDDAHPERSAVVLAPGDASNDGLLQAREIADLPLAGHLIVLSACESGTGAVVGGEGVMGLSRAFFQAGASAVVGTLWAIRDDHAAAFFALFYDGVGRGLSAGEALLEARRRAARGGLPPHVWSSVVLIGDDTFTLGMVPTGSREPGMRPALAMLSMICVLLASCVWADRRRARGG